MPRGGMRMVTIPVGAILELPDGGGRFGIVEVVWDGKQTGVLVQDLRTHAELIDEASVLERSRNESTVEPERVRSPGSSTSRSE